MGQVTTVIIWDAATGGAKRGYTWRGSGVTSVVWSPDGTALATAALSSSDEGTVWVCDTATGASRATLSARNTTVSAHDEWQYLAAWSPDGTQLASGGGDGAVRVWDASTGAEQINFPKHVGGGVTSLAWSPTSSELAVGAGDGIVSVWDTVTGESTFGVVAGERVSAVAYSRDGSLAVGVDRSVVVYHSRLVQPAPRQQTAEHGDDR